MPIEQELAQYGPLVMLFALCIYKFFDYLKAKKNGAYLSATNYERELGEINTNLNNHIVHFCADLKEFKEGTNTEIREIKKDIVAMKVELVKITALLKNK
jgi:hypothetical protein